jgi:hypothetical protein
MRWKKLIGTVALLAIITVYALLVMSLAALWLPRLGTITELIFYAVAGMAWVVPVRYLIVWMNSPGKNDLAQSEGTRRAA